MAINVSSDFHFDIAFTIVEIVREKERERC